jgi:Mg-chelatase subunit ChlD
VRVTGGVNASNVLASYRANEDVLYAEPNYKYEFFGQPNDPDFGLLWGLNNTGQFGGKEDADVDAPEAWERTVGSRDIIVAVLDSGVDTDHADLTDNMWVNTGEVPDNGIDDDGNGYIDDVHGYDFIWNDSVPEDNIGHGTHVAGTIGGVGNNNLGVAGVNWNVRIMALKIGDYWISLDAAIEALEYAVSMGAKISNNSWGGYGYSQAMKDAIAAAGAGDHLFVAAAGNNMSDNDQLPSYPASYELDNIVSVAASDDLDELGWFSNYGENSVDLAAPGVNIYSTVPGDLYEYSSGTSMASPHVAGGAALILSQRQGLHFSDLKSILMASVDKIDTLDGYCVTGGRLNLANAMTGVGGGAQAYFRFDDGGLYAEDMTETDDVLTGWIHAGRLEGNALFNASAHADMNGDQDGDGMADWFEGAYGVDSAIDDSDGDGLRNLYERLAGLNPLLPDSNSDGETDDVEDSDGDGIDNKQEQEAESHPGLEDTDDDGISDPAEFANRTHPAMSLSPIKRLALDLNGSPDPIELPNQPRFAVEGSWTVEAWVRPDAAENDGFVALRRQVGPNGINYEIGADADMNPYVRVSTMSGMSRIASNTVSIGTERWIHLAGVYDGSEGQLSLYVDGLLAGYAGTTIVEPSVDEPGTSRVIAGDGLNGRIDDIRVWSVAKSQEQIYESFMRLLSGNEGGLIAYYRFDDGSNSAGTSGEVSWNHGQIQDFATGFGFDWRTKWYNAATIVSAGASFVERTGFILPETDTDNDGLADWWERRFFTSLSSTDGSIDSDGDGLTDLGEYQAGLDPTKPYTFGGIVSDADVDSDGDGLSNANEESLYSSDPGNADTDDDGVSDGVEIENVTSPWHPMSVYSTNKSLLNLAERKSLDMGATDDLGIEVPVREEVVSYEFWTGEQLITTSNRFAVGTNGWTMEAWIRPGTDGNGDIFVFEAAEGDSFRLSLTNGSPHGVIYDSEGTIVDVGGVTNGMEGASALVSNKWTHLAIVWAPQDNSFRMYEDGVLMIARNTLKVADIVEGRAHIARNFDDGYLDEVRFWDMARETKTIEAWYEKLFPAPGYVEPPPDGWVPPHVGPRRSDATKIRNDIDNLPFYRATYEYGQPLALYYRFDDGGEYIEDFAHLNDDDFFVVGPVTNSYAYNAFGSDDADGDGVPEWWVRLHNLHLWPEVHEGPYHALEAGQGSDYPVTYVQGWVTGEGSVGTNRGLYYNLEISPDEYDVNIYKYNVWQDVNPDFDPNDPDNPTNGPNDGLVGNYRGRGQYDDWDVRVWADYGEWFTPTGTLGFAGMFFNDTDGDQMYSIGEDIWLELWNPDDADDPMFNMQELVGIVYFRTFKAYGSIGDNAAWTLVDPGNTNELTEPEINWYETTKSTHVGGDGLYSCFTKYIYLNNEPQSARMDLSLFGTDAHTIYINGNTYDPDADPNGDQLITLLKKGRNQIYVYTDNSVALTIHEENYHYLMDYNREATAMKFDMSLTVNGVDRIVRGDMTVMDPRAAWHGQAWSEHWNTFFVNPQPDEDGRLVYHQDYSIPRDIDRDGLEINYEAQLNTNPRDDDSDNDGIPDTDEDFDNDGLTNREEQDLGSDPTLADTDDDGIIDALERAAGGNPVDSLVPLRSKAINLPGTSSDYLEMPIQNRFALHNWSIEAWVRPDGGWSPATEGTIIRRSVGSLNGQPLETFVLSVTNEAGTLRPKVSFGDSSLVSTGAIGAVANDGSTWTHIAGTYDSDMRTMNLYLSTYTPAPLGSASNGTYTVYTNAVVMTNTPDIPMRYGNGPVVQRIGENFRGAIDEMRIWGRSIEPEQIVDTLGESLLGDESGLVAYYRFDDGTSGTNANAGVSGKPSWNRGHVEDYVISYGSDWKEEWRHAATIVGSVSFTNLTQEVCPLDVPVDRDNDGLPDWWEDAYDCISGDDPFGQNGADGDPDEDGVPNLIEYRNGSDPCNAESISVSWEDPDENDEDNEIDIQVGDIIPITLGRATGTTNEQSVSVFSSDETLFTVSETNVTFEAGVSIIQILLEAVGYGAGMGDHDGRLMIGDESGYTEKIVKVYEGDDLTLDMIDVNKVPVSITNIVAGDTATIRVRRERSAVGLLEMPLNVALSVSDGNAVSAPVSATIPAGSDYTYFGASGVSVKSDAVIKGEAHGYPAGDVVVDITAPTLTMYVDGERVHNIKIPASGSTHVQLRRAVAESSSQLSLTLEASETAPFQLQPSPATGPQSRQVSFPAADSAIWFDLYGTGGLHVAHSDAKLKIVSGEWTNEVPVDVCRSDMLDFDFGDPDNDGLWNEYEAMVGTDPWNADSDGDDILDGAEDFDGDGLQNESEATYGTDPTLPDTDDDGLGDLEEVTADYDPANAMNPLVARAGSFGGATNDYVELADDGRFAMDDFTIEAWIRPAGGSTGGSYVVERRIGAAKRNYYIRIDTNLQAVGGITGHEITCGDPVVADGTNWTHVALTHQRSNHMMRLLVNGMERTREIAPTQVETNSAGTLYTRIGQGFEGWIDEVRMWTTVRTPASIDLSRDRPMSGAESNLLAYYRFDDSWNTNGVSGIPGWTQGQVQDFDSDYENDWWTGWSHAGTVFGNVTVQDVPDDESPLVTDYDGDGMDDDWEIANRLDYLDAGDANSDPDGDRLNNLNEFLAGTDPWEQDSDGDGLSDGREDSDADGLSNLKEQEVYKTDPGNPDSDDDGFEDGDETVGSQELGGVSVSSPLYSRSPLVARSMVLDGDRTLVPEPRRWNEKSGLRMQRFGAMDKWVAACCVKTHGTLTGSLIERKTEIGHTNFSLRLESNVPVASFTTVNGVEQEVRASSPIPTNEWVELMGQWNPDNDSFSLHVNGITETGHTVAAECSLGQGETWVGDSGMTGRVDDIFIGEALPGAGEAAADYVLILDVSGSMWGQPLTDLQNAARDSVDAMPANGQMAIITYNHAAQLAQDFTTDKSKLNQTIDGLSAGGGTAFDPPLELLVEIFQERGFGRRVIGIFISDGYSWVTDSTIQAVDDEGIEVNTIGFAGASADPMRRIADGTGGKFYSAPTATELAQIMGGIVEATVEFVAAFYPFDDGAHAGNLAEDMVNQLDWSYALEDVTIDSADACSEETDWTWYFMDDRDTESLPVWWANFMFGEADISPDEDPDADGLSNLDEYRLGLHPQIVDTDGNGVEDGNEDYDDDDIVNRDEISVYATDPIRSDTDDDGWTDGQEADGSFASSGRNVTSPSYSRSPLVPRSLVLDGDARSVPEPLKFNVSLGERVQRFENMDRWAVACMYRPASGGESGSLVSRQTTLSEYTFDLGVTGNVPRVRFTSADGDEYSVMWTNSIPAGEWTSLLGTWESTNDTLTLYVNGDSVGARLTANANSLGSGNTVIGDGVSGHIDDVYIGEELWEEEIVQPLDIILVLDTSASMFGTPLIDLKEAARQAIDVLPETGEMAIVEFDSESSQLQQFTGDKTRLRRAIDLLEAGGATQYIPPLEDVEELFQDRPETRQRKIVFISDGAPHDSPSNDLLVSLADMGIVAHTVGFSVWPGMEGELQRIANVTGGRYYSAPDARQLEEIVVGVVRATEDDLLFAYYPFDDDGDTAEDYGHLNDWDYAIEDAVFDDSIFADEGTVFNWMFDDPDDEIAEWWKATYFPGRDEVDGDGDEDGDGLNNLYEYLAGLNPLVADSDGDLVTDEREDPDGDRLVNLDEMIQSTDPMHPDTDDDGLSDKQELDQGQDPLDSTEPYVMRYVHNDGTGHISVPGRVPGSDPTGSRYNLTEWTLGASVRLEEYPAEDAVVIGRYVQPDGLATFELGVAPSGKAYVSFDSSQAGEYRVESAEPLTTNQWVAIGARRGVDEIEDINQLSLLVDFTEKQRDVTDVLPVTGQQKGGLIIGKGFAGDLSEVRIWNTGLEDERINRLRGKTLLFGADVAELGSLDPNNGSLLILDADHLELEEWTIQSWFKTESGGLILEKEAGDYTDYALTVNPGEGTVSVSMDVLGRAGFPQEEGPILEASMVGTYEMTGEMTGLNDGEWHHVVATFNGSSLELYVDGMFLASSTVPPNDLIGQIDWDADLDGAIYVIFDGFVEGSGNLVVGDGFDGLIDEVAIFDYARSFIDIHRTFGEKVQDVSTLLYYDFDDIRTEEGFLLPRMGSGSSLLVGDAEIDKSVGSTAPIKINPLSVLRSRLAGYWPLVDGRWTNGTRAVEDFAHRLDHGHAGTFEPSTNVIDFVPSGNPWTNGQPMAYPDFYPTESDNPSRMDSDGDGMSDEFEQYFGLDPNLASDAGDDMDGDGLINRLEYEAGTDPTFRDSDGDGVSDWDEDSDQDGLPNGVEQLRGSHPGIRDMYVDGDRIPDQWEVQYMGIVPATGQRGMDPAYYDADRDPDEDGWSSYAEYLGYRLNDDDVLQRGCNPLDADSYPMPRITIRARYHGKHAADISDLLTVTTEGTNQTEQTTNIVLRLAFYDDAEMDGFPIATHNMGSPTNETRRLDSGHLVEGGNYVFGYLDMDEDEMFDPETEPAGISQAHPFDVCWADSAEVELGLTDWEQSRGYTRFSWPAHEGVVEYTIGGAVAGNTNFSRVMEAPRHYWHEGDYLNAGTYGFGPNETNIVWNIYTNMNMYGKNYPQLFETKFFWVTNDVAGTLPELVTPHDFTYVYAANDLEWKMDPDATAYRLQFRMDGHDIMETKPRRAPFRNSDGVYRQRLPFYAGDEFAADGSWTNDPYWGSSPAWTNGRYEVRVQALFGSEMSASQWSQWQSFNLDVQHPTNGGKDMIEGMVHYFGAATNVAGPGADIVVESYTSRDFCGEPDARITVPDGVISNAGMNAMHAPFGLGGLHSDTHFVMAFVDMDQDGELDLFEPWGFITDSQVNYEARMLDMSAGDEEILSDEHLVILDRDTDDDELSDAWEWMHYGSLNKGTYDTAANGLSMLMNYQLAHLGVVPTVAGGDVDGDGLTDYEEVNYDGDPDSYEPGASDTDVAASDTDGDHLTDDGEDGIAGPDPRNYDTDGEGVNDFLELTYSEWDTNSYPTWTDWTNYVATNRNSVSNWYSYDPYDPATDTGTDLVVDDTDSDNGGVSDYDELTVGKDPLDAADDTPFPVTSSDTDGDGLGDTWEQSHFGGIAATDGYEDVDGDGATNLEEYRAKTDPNDPTSMLRIMSVEAETNQYPSLTWEGQPGVSYGVRYKDSLMATSWTDTGITRNGGGIHTYTDTDPALPDKRYYQIYVK